MSNIQKLYTIYLRMHKQKINDIQKDHAKELDAVMSTYDLI